ncbi:MAG: GTP 3',8-cyclase MoaA [Nannocystis sp.]|nr:GTP 3',8-cyclase MoaA [Nannocystis sp.]MBA3547915.1 GTP 3',8-cyclase MoaA [Nannocystis sp.]
MTLIPLRRLRPPPAAGPFSGPPLVDPQARAVKYLRVSLTDRCNFRCTYCMPEAGVEHVQRRELLTLEEVALVVRAFAAWGVERVRLTGGEPTVRQGLVELVAELSRIPVGSNPVENKPDRRLQVVMTTNGARLQELAAPLFSAGLAGLTVSIDSLDPIRFREITRRGELSQVLAGLEAATAAGFRDIKLNTVAVRGFNDDEVGPMATWAWARGHVPRFIELMPMSGGRLFVPGELLAAADLRRAVAAHVGAALVPDAGEGLRGLGPATYWRVDDSVHAGPHSSPHAGQRLGVIAAMTENFCASCNRLRISATGQLHNCLARDDTGDLRSVLRPYDPEALESRVRAILGHKRPGHEFRIDGQGGPDKAMISIGG